MDDEEPGHQAAVASAAAAALVAALRQRLAGSFAGQVAAAAFGADPEVVHCSIAVILGSSSGAICSSGNLLRPHEVGWQMAPWVDGAIVANAPSECPRQYMPPAPELTHLHSFAACRLRACTAARAHWRGSP